MLASKPYSGSLGMQASQTPTPSYSVGSSQKSAGLKPQEGAMFTSFTDSDFLDGQDGLEAVRWVSLKREISNAVLIDR